MEAVGVGVSIRGVPAGADGVRVIAGGEVDMPVPVGAPTVDVGNTRVPFPPCGEGMAVVVPAAGRLQAARSKENRREKQAKRMKALSGKQRPSTCQAFYYIKLI
jgi:hypothetical protein